MTKNCWVISVSSFHQLVGNSLNPEGFKELIGKSMKQRREKVLKEKNLIIEVSKWIADSIIELVSFFILIKYINGIKEEKQERI